MSTPSEPRPPHDGPALEPIRVLRPRRTDALAELMREFREDTGQDDSGYESVALPGRPPAGSEALTRELPPVARATRPRTDAASPGAGLRRAAVAVAVLAAAVIGFGGALLLRGEPDDAGAAPAPHPPRSAAPTPDPTPTPPATAAVDPDGAGTLREGASGPEVTELQQRLLRVPDVYRDGSTSGRYDPTLTAAVARFQLWYGIRGDETGVYGDDTRAALESRTPAGTG
ncbi:peptidoglycan-binding domain-containing protein [Streptomyces sp. 378]|uniref:peptidoglycan-binding domain-containing protein n=1 Tax=Streptomyces sp. 378 TaxID=3049412 RepID=UPI0024C3DCA7|nr:peptidoglycan-binding domain-containing protein [Streptomyces sp. 378]MDK1346701.1 peptidoglycan-binding domain-containing protein [Streptomyces sp. 378]